MIFIKNNITILGSSGGVARALLSILNKSIVDINDPIHKFIASCDLHLLDINQKYIKYFYDLFPNLSNRIKLYEFDANYVDLLEEHLKKTKTSILIDISWADTIKTLDCCNKLGILYINSAFESPSVDIDEDVEGFGLSKRYDLFEDAKNNFKNTKAIICSGMNPGVVNWMALTLIKLNSNKIPRACYIVELDTSFYKDKSLAKKDTMYVSWSPECFLDEAILSYPLFMKQQHQLFLYDDVYKNEFKVTLDDLVFYGCLMPHEESITLGNMFDMECGFIYRINEHTTNIIKNNLKDLDVLWDWPMKTLDPLEAPLIGEDLVGVLLVYDNEEKYMYNVLSNEEIFAKYKVNATYFQVACGLYSALSTLLLDKIPKGVYYVEELISNTKSKYGTYLSYYMKNFVIGTNQSTDGTLLDRISNIR